jgi:hypothetical protein
MRITTSITDATKGGGTYREAEEVGEPDNPCADGLHVLEDRIDPHPEEGHQEEGEDEKEERQSFICQGFLEGMDCSRSIVLHTDLRSAPGSPSWRTAAEKYLVIIGRQKLLVDMGQCNNEDRRQDAEKQNTFQVTH